VLCWHRFAQDTCENAMSISHYITSKSIVNRYIQIDISLLVNLK